MEGVGREEGVSGRGGEGGGSEWEGWRREWELEYVFGQLWCSPSTSGTVC